MTDGSWNRQQQPFLPSSAMLKRPRTEYDISPSGLTSGGNEMHNYIGRNDDHTGHRILKDTKTLGSAFDRYLQSAGQLTSFNSGEASAIGSVGLERGVGGLPRHSLTDPAVMGHPGGGHDLARGGRNVNYGDQLPVDAASMPGPETVPLPPDASSTLYVEGLPSDSTRREVAHIFRPFVGYREVRLVSKESKHRGGDPLILCFVDFANPACAATALSALQGYKVDELNPESSHLRLQFSRFPGPRSGPGPRGKRVCDLISIFTNHHYHNLIFSLAMTDGFWNRQQQQPLQPSSAMLKRPRTEYDMSPSGLTGGNEMHNYIARNDDHTGHRMLKDTKTLGSAYDRYLQSAGQLTSFNSGEASAIGGVGLGRGVGGLPRHSLTDPAVMGHPGGGHDLARNGRNVNYGGQLTVDAASMPGPETVPLPPDASSTLYVEGLPSDSTRREVAHIFRPFVGYREVRLVSKESKHRGGDPLILCFVDFANPACAATALSALQGYKVDELNPESSHLRLQFSRFPGPRSGPGPRGKR
ncbi:RNA-binding protein 2 [Glycine soja]